MTALAREGQRLAAGDKLFAVDNRPSVVMIGDEAAFRDLSDGVADGADVAQLEQNLAGLGYTADGQVVIDEHFDAATTAAVEAWQTALGIEASGTVLSSDVVFLPAAATVVAAEVAVGDLIQPGAQLLDLGNETLVASADLPVGRIGEVGEGDAVAFTLADGSVVNGSARTIGTEARRAADAPVTQSTVVLTAQLDPTDNPGAVDFADVRLDVTTATRSRVLTVPVAAIVDSGDGQAAMRVRSDTADSLVPFDAGLAAAGYVEIADGALTEGDAVLLPGNEPVMDPRSEPE